VQKIQMPAETLLRMLPLLRQTAVTEPNIRPISSGYCSRNPANIAMSHFTDWHTCLSWLHCVGWEALCICCSEQEMVGARHCCNHYEARSTYWPLCCTQFNGTLSICIWRLKKQEVV